MPLGQNKLIQKTSNKRNNTNITRNTNITNKKAAAGRPSKDPGAVTYETRKMTFYVKGDLLNRLYNLAYWERQSLTQAFNVVLQDGLKGKNTKNKS